MGRDDARDRRQRRALEEVGAALRRNQVEAAVEGLLKLDATARDPVLPTLGGLLREEIRKAFSVRQWARLQMLASRTDRESRLLSAGSSEADEQEARWALLWGSAMSNDWSRARVQLEALRPRLLATAPKLARALDAWISSTGRPVGDALLDLIAPVRPGWTSAEIVPGVPESALPDPRLGFGRHQQAPRGKPPGPQNVDEVEPRVLACLGSRPWPEFVTTVMDWVRSAPVDVARKIWTLAAQVSMRELLVRLPSGERHAAEPARWIARACKEAGAPPELLPEIQVALKAATAVFQRGGAADHDAAALYAPIAEVAALYPELAMLVEHTVVGTLVFVEARPQLLGLIETLARRSAAAPLWAKGLRLFALTDPDATGPIPPWLVGCLERVLDRDGELAVCLRALPRKVRAATLDPLVAAMPLPLAERALDQLWQGADDVLRRELAAAFDDLLQRARASAPRAGSRTDRRRKHNRLLGLLAAHGIGGELDRADIDRLLAAPELRALMVALDDDDDDERLPLQGGALRLWRRFGERMLPHGIRFLDLALVHAGSVEEQRRFVEQYFAGRSSITAELEALRAAAADNASIAFQAVHDRVVMGHRGDREALAVGLLAAKEMGAPRGLLGELAKALTEADASSAAPRSASVDAALLEARLFAPRPRRQRPKPQRPAKTPKPRTKRAQAGQSKAKQPTRSGTQVSTREQPDLTIVCPGQQTPETEPPP